MIKIAVFCDTPKNPSGIVSHCNALKRMLESKGDFKVSVFSNLPYIRFLRTFNYYDKSAIKNALLSDDFDIIHIHGFISTIPLAVISCMKLMNLHTPVVYTPHAHPFYTLNHPFRNKIFFHLCVKSVLKKADTVIGINNEDFSLFKKYNGSVGIIPHWSENIKATIKPKQKNETPIILFVGRNDSNKNLKILYSLPQNKYKVICVTNSKPEREDFIFKYRITDEELSSLYEQASLTVVPSRYEAFSYVSLDSLCVGTPVLMSDRVRIADFLQNISGITIYEYGKPEQFLQKIDAAMNKIVDVDKIRKLFSEEVAFNSYSTIYKKFINN